MQLFSKHRKTLFLNKLFCKHSYITGMNQYLLS